MLSSEFGVGRSAVSRHLDILRRAEFARVRVEGPVRVYRLDSGAIERVHRAVDHLDELWNARYGWPYIADPLASEVTEDNDLWRWIGG